MTLKKIIWLALITIVPIFLKAQINPATRIKRAAGPGYLMQSDSIGAWRFVDSKPIKLGTGLPVYTPNSDSVLYADTTNFILYAFVSTGWEVLAKKNVDDADADPTNELQNWGNLPGIPPDIADGDDNTQLTELGQVEESGQVPVTYNPGDTLFFDLFYNGSSQGAVWVTSGNDALYQTGDVVVGNNLFVDGKSKEFQEGALDVIKLVPEEISVETLTWGNLSTAGENWGVDPGLTDPYDLPPFGGDTTSVSRKGWAKVFNQTTFNEDTVRVFADYDTLLYTMSSSPDADSYIDAYFGPGPFAGDIKSIWWNDVRFSSPVISDDQKWPAFYAPFPSPLTVLYTDRQLTTGENLYGRIPIDSTGTEPIIVSKLDTTTYTSGYEQYMTVRQVDSMIAASQIGDYTNFEVQELYVNPLFLGLSSLHPGEVSGMASLAHTLMYYTEMLAFGSEAFLTVRNSESRPVNIRTVDADLDLGVELRMASDAGIVSVYDENNNTAVELRGSGNSNINNTYFRTDRWGAVTKNATVDDTLRAEVISLGATVTTGSGNNTHASNILLTGDGALSLTNLEADQITMPAEDKLPILDGASKVIEIDRTGAGTDFNLYGEIGGQVVAALRSTEPSYLKGGLLISDSNTDTVRAKLHIKADQTSPRPSLAYNYPSNEQLIIENFEDDARLNLLSGTGGAINFSSTTDMEAGQIKYTGNGFQVNLNGSNLLDLGDSQLTANRSLAVNTPSGANTLLGDNSYLNAITGNAGIGTTSPSQKLEVAGTVLSSGVNGFYSTGTNGLIIESGEQFMIRNDGNATYFLLSNDGAALGGYNTLRPMSINNSSGQINMGNGALYVNESSFVQATSQLAVAGYPLSGYSLTNIGRAVSTSGISIGSAANLRTAGQINIAGSRGSLTTNVQDGTGRFNWRWNATSGGSPVFEETGDRAWEMDGDGIGGFGLSLRESTTTGVAGDPVGWNTFFQVGAGGMDYNGVAEVDALDFGTTTAPAHAAGRVYHAGGGDLKVSDGSSWNPLGGGGVTESAGVIEFGTYMIQWGEVNHSSGDVSNTINFNSAFSAHPQVTCNFETTGSAGMPFVRLDDNISTTSVTVFVDDLDTTIPGGRIHWIAIGPK